MFPLHDRTRRRICLAAFGILCLLPTASVLAWCAARHLPWHVWAEARRIERLCGMHVTLAGLHHPRPGQIVYEGLELANPETGLRVLRCARLEAAWNKRSDADGHEKKPLLILTASLTEIDATEWDEIRRLFDRVLARRAGPGAVDIRLMADEMVLRDGKTAHTLDDVQATLKTASEVSVAEWSFRPRESEATDPIRARIRRNRSEGTVANEFELYTGQGVLNGDLLALGLGIRGPLDAKCFFRGYFRAKQTGGGWNGELFGMLSRLDLDRLVSDHFPHTLSGPANVTLRRVRFRGGRIEEAEGSFVAGPGVLSCSLLEAGVKHLGLGLIRGWERPDSEPLIPYEQLAATFSLDAHGLQLRGACGQGEPGTLLLVRQGSLVGEPRQVQPVAGLLTTLAPQEVHPLPLTRQTEWLARRLPLADVAKPATPPPNDIAPLANDINGNF